MSEEVRLLLDEFDIETSLTAIKRLKREDGGFPSQYAEDKESGSWATAVVLLLHRKYNFLSDDDVSDMINFFLKNYCIALSKKYILFGENKEQYYGWGSFIDKDDKQPIPIITSFVLLSLVGYHNLNDRLNKLYKLALIWLINQQQGGGYWDTDEDYYSNMCILMCLVELKRVFKNSDKTLYGAIENTINKAKNYYRNYPKQNVKKHEQSFYDIICMLLGEATHVEPVLTEKLMFEFDYRAKLSTRHGENFSYEKASSLYYLHYISLSGNKAQIENGSIVKVLKYLKDKQMATGFWEKDKKSCLWLTCDILIMLKYVEHSIECRAGEFYRESCNMHHKIHWLVSAWGYIKILWKIKKPISSALKMYEKFG